MNQCNDRLKITTSNVRYEKRLVDEAALNNEPEPWFTILPRDMKRNFTNISTMTIQPLTESSATFRSERIWETKLRILNKRARLKKQSRKPGRYERHVLLTDGNGP